jgi:hypothetical protein
VVVVVGAAVVDVAGATVVLVDGAVVVGALVVAAEDVGTTATGRDEPAQAASATVTTTVTAATDRWRGQRRGGSIP